MNISNKKIISDYIEEIWNHIQLNKIDNYIHSAFVDHSLPPTLPANKEGLKRWIKETSKSFEHRTIIEEMVCEGNKVMIKIKMLLRHIGKWRGIAPTGAEIYVVGYRCFKLEDNKVIEHWALIDGNAIENQIKEANHGCKIQE